MSWPLLRRGRHVGRESTIGPGGSPREVADGQAGLALQSTDGVQPWSSFAWGSDKAARGVGENGHAQAVC